MSPRVRILLSLACALIAATLLVTLAAALGAVLWQEDGVGLCTAVDDQQNPQIVSDGARGAIVTWQDYRFASLSSSIFAQRVDPAGNPLWQIDDVVLCSYTTNATDPQIVSDGSGGAIVTWGDHRSGTFVDIYAQRVNANGSVLWDTDGMTICAAAQDQAAPRIVSDGSEGAIVTWGDFRSGVHVDIYAQRVYANGKVVWDTDGVTICAAANSQGDPQIAPDGSGGAIVTWYDGRSGTRHDIYAQRVYSDGTPAWTADGVSLCVTADDQFSPQIASDGSGGAIVAWEDYRAFGSDSDIYAQRVDASGSTLWYTDGITICTATNYQDSPQIVSDGSGGAIVVWADKRSSYYDIYAQRVDGKGNTLWYTNGVTICAAAGHQGGISPQLRPQIAPDGSGGAIVTWGDERGSEADIYAQWVDADGDTQWKTDGVRLCGAGDHQDQPQITSDGSGGAIVAWTDGRGSDDDIYAQRVGNVTGVYLPVAVKRYE